MIEKFSSILKESVPFSRNPLGIFALIIIFTFPCVIGFSFFSGVLSYDQLWAVLVCMIVFLFSVIAMFFILITRHHTKLYGPGDFKDQDDFTRLAFGQGFDVMSKVFNSLISAASRGEDGKFNGLNPTTITLNESTLNALKAQALQRVMGVNHRHHSLLWVDDNPDNNIWEIRAFDAIGISVTCAKSTREALEKLEGTQFSAIISDMGRAEGDREGYVLLEQVRRRGIEAPFFIYSSSNHPDHIAEAQRKGAQATNNPQRLYSMVVEALRT
ncbi:MAG: response regulator [Alphaproteobacteria bacterium]|nr:response regulator [Alphaproteobacteria bacterium]